MGCKGSKHALLHGGGCGGLPAARQPEPQPRRRGSCSSGRLQPPRPSRHSVALRSSTLGTLSLDRAAAAVAAAGLSFDAAGGDDDVEGMMKAGHDVGDGGAGKAKMMMGPSPSFGGWRPTTPPSVAAAPAPKRQKKRVVAAARTVAPRTPNKTPARDPEEINVWELMKGLDDDDDEQEDEEMDDEDCVDNAGVERTATAKAQSAPGSPSTSPVAVFDPELLDSFRKALDGLTTTPGSPLPPADGSVKRDGAGGGDDVVEKRAIQTFPGIVRARVDVFQEKINAKTKRAAKKQDSPAPATPAPPESAGRVVVYLTSLRGIRQTYEDCWSTSAVLRGYGVRVDERDLSMHAGFKAELRAALGGDHGDGGQRLVLPQVFADGRHLGGAEEVRRLHEAGELASALGACDATAPQCTATKGGGAGTIGVQQDACCAGCGGVRFVPCERCSGSCKVFVEDEDGGSGGRGAFRRCPDCNENGLVKCPVC